MRERSPILVKVLFPATPLFLRGDVDSSKVYNSFWRLMTRTILASQLPLQLMKKLRGLLSNSWLTHWALVPKHIEWLCRHDFSLPLSLSYFDSLFGYFYLILHLRKNTFYFWLRLTSVVYNSCFCEFIWVVLF